MTRANGGAEGVQVDVRSIAVELGGTPILRDVTFRLGRGEVMGLLGPNGAGKTTTIAAVLGLIPPSGGAIRVFGLDPFRHGPRVRSQLGALPERGGFYGWMTASAYLTFFARLYGIEFAPEEVEQRLNQVGLQPRQGQRIETFSHGMRQRLALARALLGDPELLVLDEPTSGLDPRGRREVHDLLLGLAQSGVGILLCTHLLDDVERLCDGVTIIAQGRTIESERTVDLPRSPASSEPGKAVRYRLRVAEPGELSPLPNGVSLLECRGQEYTVELAGTTPEAAWRELMLTGWRLREIERLDDCGSALEGLYLRLTAESGTAS
jgi:ABC-2 type transport system ATP-binding protein